MICRTAASARVILKADAPLAAREGRSAAVPPRGVWQVRGLEVQDRDVRFSGLGATF